MVFHSSFVTAYYFAAKCLISSHRVGIPVQEEGKVEKYRNCSLTRGISHFMMFGTHTVAILSFVGSLKIRFPRATNVLFLG